MRMAHRHLLKELIAWSGSRPVSKCSPHSTHSALIRDCSEKESSSVWGHMVRLTEEENCMAGVLKQAGI